MTASSNKRNAHGTPYAWDHIVDTQSGNRPKWLTTYRGTLAQCEAWAKRMMQKGAFTATRIVSSPVK